MSHYEIEIAKAESRTPLFYYPYSVELKTDKAKKTLALFFRNRFKFEGGIQPITPQDFEFVNEKMELLSGKYTFHYNNPNETENTRLSTVKQGALRTLAGKEIYGFLQYKENVKNYGVSLAEGEDFEIIIGERVDIEQPVKLTFDDLPDLMGVESEEPVTK